jgi:hypothetical protein
MNIEQGRHFGSANLWSSGTGFARLPIHEVRPTDIWADTGKKLRYLLREAGSIGKVGSGRKDSDMTRSRLALAALVAFTAFGAVSSAQAQYYPYPPQRPYYGPNPYGGYVQPNPYGGYVQPNPYGGGYYAPRRPVIIGNICVTSRGACRTRPRQEGALCGCNIPGFGPKQGNVAADPNF